MNRTILLDATRCYPNSTARFLPDSFRILTDYSFRSMGFVLFSALLWVPRKSDSASRWDVAGTALISQHSPRAHHHESQMPVRASVQDELTFCLFSMPRRWSASSNFPFLLSAERVRTMAGIRLTFDAIATSSISRSRAQAKKARLSQSVLSQPVSSRKASINFWPRPCRCPVIAQPIHAKKPITLHPTSLHAAE